MLDNDLPELEHNRYVIKGEMPPRMAVAVVLPGGKRFDVVDGDLSDGYHTFGDLYRHRNLLFVALAVMFACGKKSFWVRDPSCDGWDLIVMEWDFGDKEQISYHVPVSDRPLYEGIIPERDADNYVYDGHTPDDVIERLIGFINAHA